jgi:hypothetical protein
MFSIATLVLALSAVATSALVVAGHTFQGF